MICVSIGRGRHKHMIAEHRHLVEQGAQLVELRLDYLRTKVDLTRLLENRPSPVIITVRREEDGGRFRQDEQQRRVLLRAAIAHGVEYVDLEEDIAGTIPRYGKTKRIVSFHDFRKTPEDLEALHARMARLDPDIIKIATMANHPHDNVRMLKLVAQAQVPTVGMCMGDIGTPSRILCGKFGAPFTYATFHHERALAPGQLSFDEMRNIYHYDDIRHDTEVYGVMGDPIAHSYSPLVHNAAFRELKLNKVYVPFRVPREDVEQFLAEAPELGIRGLSVTIPHKEAVVPLLHEKDRSVAEIGAANTIVWEDGIRKGYNTDYQGAMDALQVALRSSAGSDQIAAEPLQGRIALVLGAGGAAKAIAYGLKRQGARVVVCGRTRRHADELAEALGCESTDWDRRHAVRPDVLVNCTPLGMHPKVDETPFDRLYLRSGMIVFDTVYNPESTLLVKDAREQGCHTITGVEMFVRQAALQFKLFTGQSPPPGLMRSVLRRATSPVKY
jgi:3-dehydroquinate dehydratase/shikimate dehydrogenase